MNYFSNLKIREIDFINLKFFLSLLILFFIGKKKNPFYLRYYKNGSYGLADLGWAVVEN